MYLFRVSFDPEREPQQRISAPPTIESAQGFLGTHGFVHGQQPNQGQQLASGPGVLTGSVRTETDPVVGLRLRLVVNGGAQTDWAVTDSSGVYAIRVPYGVYRIDGYTLASSDLPVTMNGKVDAPWPDVDEVLITVKDNTPVRALDLSYVDPVRYTGPLGEVAAGADIVVTWKPYPGAAKYRVQIYESESAQMQRALLHDSGAAHTTANELALAVLGIRPKAGMQYRVDIQAISASGQVMSRTPSTFARQNFRAAAR